MESSLPCSSPFVAVYKLEPLCRLRTWHSVISFSLPQCMHQNHRLRWRSCNHSFGFGSPELGPIGALPCAW